MSRRKPPETPGGMACPACSRRDDSLVQPDCPICSGAGVLQLGPIVGHLAVAGQRPMFEGKPLSQNDIIASAVRIHLEDVAQACAVKRFPSDMTAWQGRRVALAAAVERMRDSRLLGEPADGAVNPIPPGVTVDTWTRPQAEQVGAGRELVAAPLNPGVLDGAASLAWWCALHPVQPTPDPEPTGKPAGRVQAEWRRHRARRKR